MSRKPRQPRYSISVIPHADQRYQTCGDWVVYDGSVAILVSDMGNPDSEFAVGIHELIEQHLCARNGITMEQVDEFDTDYEEAREAGGVAKCGCKPTKTSEPGSDKHAPYRNQHEFAMKVEKMLVKKMGISWEKHDKLILSL